MNIFQIVTDRILNQLKTGIMPWQKTWTAGMPKSLTTKREYRGVNILLLGTTAHTSRYWVTYRQALRLGGHIRKGEKATPVVYWKWRTPEEMRMLRERSGKEEIAPCIPFVSSVFNLDQVENLTRPDDDVPQRLNRKLEIAGQILDVMPDQPRIEHSATFQPAYSRLTDCVKMPGLSQFHNASQYYATLFHELVHSTGHARRLDRFVEAEGDRVEKYSFEELVAEFGAAFLCCFAGIENRRTEELQASYIEGWARVFQQDSRVLVRAASAAQRAADYIRGKIPATEEQSVAASESVSVQA